MGMYFNTAQTMLMAQVVNSHFANDVNGGDIAHWRNNRADLQNHTLPQIADMHGAHGADYPLGSDPGGAIRRRWRSWLTKLEQSNNPNTGNRIGKDIRDYIHDGLANANCLEIVFAVVPAAAVSVDAPVDYPLATPAGSVGRLITIHTLEIDDPKW
ncbi:hypothetical protein SAMN02745126_00004 [Enhydrobacter aerosaccus]|uniref:Uncharacterized protein n=1 Tax=Enhydrobacter aerosaccus TaxID=225324 RepID=A0A1T4JJL7_9HYPH|nr:hypothetical protein [Enhydrobacter aerosaccus]SJZ30370.1 hypothetical protein SAMN02745126_00004 [Enhydrobacter aerosaccus]